MHVTPKWRRRKNWHLVSGLWSIWFLSCHWSHHRHETPEQFPKDHLPHGHKLTYTEGPRPGQRHSERGRALTSSLQPRGNVRSLKKKSQKFGFLCENSQSLNVGSIVGFVFASFFFFFQIILCGPNKTGLLPAPALQRAVCDFWLRFCFLDWFESLSSDAQYFFFSNLF